MNREPAHSISKRGRLDEGRPTKRTPEVVTKIAEAIARGLTDREAGLLGFGTIHEPLRTAVIELQQIEAEVETEAEIEVDE